MFPTARLLASAAAIGLFAPAFAQLAPPPGAPLAPVEQSALARDAFGTGLLERSQGALGEDLWRGADAEMLATLLALSPARPASPAVAAAMRRTLLASGDAPQGASPALGGAKLGALVRAGFIDEAREIESLSIGAKGEPSVIEAMATADLLTRDVAGACDKSRRLAGGGESAFAVKLRILCYVTAGELDAAGLAFSVLRDKGAVSDTDAAIFAPMIAGGKAKAGAAPADAVHYAALAHLGLSPSPADLGAAEAGVLAALARDEAAPWPTRLEAARLAAVAGAFDAARLRTLFAAAPLGVADVSSAGEALRQRKDDPMTAAAAYQSVKSVAAPEFIRDRAVRVGEAIAASSNFSSLLTNALLYADEIKELDGAIVEPRAAEAFALARVALGDAKGASAWKAAADAARALSPATPAPAADLARLIALLDADKSLRADVLRPLSPRPPASSQALGAIVAAALDAAASGAKGQSALAAIAAAQGAASGDPVATAVFLRGLERAGLADLARRAAVEAALAGGSASAPPVVGAAPTRAATPTPAGVRLAAPRVKPPKTL